MEARRCFMAGLDGGRPTRIFPETDSCGWSRSRPEPDNLSGRAGRRGGRAFRPK